MPASVGDPDVVVPIDAQSVRVGEKPFGERAQELSGGIEFEECVRAAVEHQDISLRVHRHPRARPEVHARRQLEHVRHRIVPQVGHTSHGSADCFGEVVHTGSLLSKSVIGDE
jgi:hypothetical protein